MNSKAFIQRHPVITYFCMTYLISWLGAGIIVAPKLLHGQALTQIDGLLMFPMLLLGPLLTGLTLTGICDGKKGIRDLFSRMGRWRVGARWYLALLIPPVFITAVLLVLSALVSPLFLPHLNPHGILYGIAPGFIEEFGWMGFVFPQMRKKQRALPAGLVLGLFWGLWHLPVIDFLGAAYPHGLYWLPYALAFIAIMIAIRVLIVWVYSHTNSVLLAQLLHASSTAFLVVLSPLSISPAQEALWYAVYAAALWLLVASIAILSGPSLVRQPRGSAPLTQ